MKAEGFKRRGFYLHASWQYKHPFAVRAWSHEDYAGMFDLLRALGIDTVMIWPMTELAPPPLSENDRAYFTRFRDIVQSAAKLGLECWLTISPCVTTTDAVRPAAMRDRVFYPNMRTLRFDQPGQYEAYMAHLADILRCLDNADGYVFIDGDPGGYPGAQPAEFMRMLHGARRVLDGCRHGRPPKIIPWIWSGWGADWEKEGVWKPDLRRLVKPFIKAIQADPPGEPWEALPGRSIREGHANGRINFVLAEEAGLLDRSTLMTYEIIEFEPSPPAFVIQFDDIRRVIREEMDKAPLVKGIMGNAQQPVSALHNLFYFARCAQEPEWLDTPDETILGAFAAFLGGDPDVLAPAWQAARSTLESIPDSLPDRVRDAPLRSEHASLIPGGPETYRILLSEFVRARMDILKLTATAPRSSSEAIGKVASAAAAIIRWWSHHGYVGTGANGPGFRAEYTHPALLKPLATWIKQLHQPLDEAGLREAIAEATTLESIDGATAEGIVRDLLRATRR